MKRQEKTDKRDADEKLIDLDKVRAIITKNYMVLRRDRTRMIALIVFPIVMISIFGATTGVTPKHLATAIVDNDQSLLSSQVAGQLQTLDVLSIEYSVGSESEAKKLLDEGKAKAVVIIPQGFEDAIKEGRQTTIRLMVDQSDATVAQIASASIRGFITGLSKQASAQMIAQEQVNIAIAARKVAALESLLSSGAQAAGTVDAYDLAAEQATLARYRLMQSTDTLTKLSQAVAANLYSPTNADYLNELTFAYDNPRAKASVVSEINLDQQYVAQMAMYSGLAAGNMMVLRSVASTQALIAQAKAGSLALSAQLDSAAPVADSVQVTLEGFASTDVSSLVDPITVESVQVYGQRQGIDFALPALVALIIFQGAIMGMGRAIAGERHDGSLTRVFLTPTSNTTILLGTQLFYMIFETLRAICIVLIAMLVFGLTISGNPFEVLLIIILFTMGATGVGLVISSFAKTEEQFMPMSMLISLPSMFLAGAFFPIQTMPAILQGLAKVLPIYYAGDALRGVMVKGFSLMQVWPDVLFLSLFALVMLALSVMVFKREVM